LIPLLKHEQIQIKCKLSKAKIKLIQRTAFKASQCGSKVSTTCTSASSFLRAQKRAAAKKVAIVAEQAASEQLQALELEELKLRQKKVQLSLSTKLAVAKAEEEVYTLNEDSDDTEVQIQHIQHPPAPNLSALDTSAAPPHVEISDEKVEPVSSTPTGNGAQTHFPPSLSASEIHPVPQVQKVDMETTNPTVDEGSISRIMEQNQLQQQRLFEVMQMPRAELLTFDGDPLQY
jgi:hypothetical protein